MKIEPLYMAKSLGNMAAAQVRCTTACAGYNGTICTACASGTQAIGEAGMLIRSGRAELVLTGGAKAGISELGLAGFSVMRALTAIEDPERASRPFDGKRDGFIPAEGAGALVLESLGARPGGAAPASMRSWPASAVPATPFTWSLRLRTARERRARWWRRCGTRHEPRGRGLRERACDQHAARDSAETAALKRVFGEGAYRLAVSATKGMIGHGLGASGGMETVATVKTVETGTIHRR